MPNPLRPELFGFLRELARHNRREWFEANRARYERDVRQPALGFVAELAPRLRKLSPRFLAIPKGSGGSLFRIHRDVRFSKDKRPYKTHVGLRFPHESAAADVHAPGFYLHLERGQCFVGLGIWQPDPATLKRLRAAVVSNPAGWKRARDDRRFRKAFRLEGESLKTAPRGVDPGHPLIEDLRRTDFVAVARLTERDVTAPGFPARFAALCSAGKPFVKWLCGAVGVRF